MWTFQYKHGDRPLDGYTIQRAAGRGGFGEVYYAVSDSGREVALKVISGYEQIELRGISQCMNLKSPHLVTIFDVRQNAEGRWFVIMEFVSGANLRQLMDESPAGLGTQKTAFFLREIAKGLTFLHECGIVHRDLKPANIFYENGYVKIGDYGLSKAITPDQHSGHTVTVGTVHYMAPEVGAGKYDRGVDIYALGALVYEMLTGTVPHIGASPSEVLMKHLSAEPDFTNIPEPFNRVIRKAMAKDPTARYQSVQEMVEDVFGAEHIRQSVSVFSPQDLSMIAEHAAKRIGGGSGSGGGVGVATGSSAATRDPAGARANVRIRLGNVFEDVFEKVFDSRGDQASANAATTTPATGPVPPPVLDVDPLTAPMRRTIAAMFAVAASVLGAVLGDNLVGGEGAILFIFPFVWGVAFGSLLAARRVLPAMQHESFFVRRLILGLLSGGIGLLVTIPFFGVMGGRLFGRHHVGELYLGALLAVVVTWLVLPIERLVVANRRMRLNFGIVTAACVMGVVFGGMFGGTDEVAAVAGVCAAAAMLMLQMLAPWNPREARANKAEYKAIRTATARHNWANQFSRMGENLEQAAVRVKEQVLGHIPPAPPVPPIAPLSSSAPAPIESYWWRPTSAAGRWIWGVLMVLTFAASIAFFVAGGFAQSAQEATAFVVFGYAALHFSIIALVRVFTKRFYGWWGYLIKPMLILACATTTVAISMFMGTARMGGPEIAISMFFLMLSLGGGIVLICIPGRYRVASAPPPIPGTNPSTAPANLDWQGVAPIEAVRGHYGGTFLGFVAGIFLLAMLAVGLVYAFDVPDFIAAGLADPSLAIHLQRDVFGTAEWPAFVQRMLCGIVVMLMFIAMSFVTLARRSRGGLHILRGLLGIVTFFFSILILGKAFYSSIWQDIANQGHLLPGQALMLAINHVSGGGLVCSAIVFMLGVLMIGWPARRWTDVSAPAKKRSLWPVLAIVLAALIVVPLFIAMFVSVAAPTVQIRSSSPNSIIIPNPQLQDFEPFRGRHFPQQNMWPATQPRSGGASGGGFGGRVTVTVPNKTGSSNLRKYPTTSKAVEGPEIPEEPQPSAQPPKPAKPAIPAPPKTPATEPAGIFEE
jgi:hypothetical protein